MVNSSDFKKANGRVDWEAFHAAEVEAGEACHQCGTFILNGTGYRSLCGQCVRMALFPEEEVCHDSLVRCPHCGETFDIEKQAGKMAEYGTYEQGPHRVTCYECDKEFKIETHVSYSYTSPPRKKAKGE